MLGCLQAKAQVATQLWLGDVGPWHPTTSVQGLFSPCPRDSGPPFLLAPLVIRLATAAEYSLVEGYLEYRSAQSDEIYQVT